jgi:hypothetical protein
MLTQPPDLALFLELPIPAAIDRYAIGVENFDRRVFELTDAELDTAFFPEAGVGRWPARVLLGHLADAELAQVHRMRRTIAEDHPVLSVWDENAFIDAGLYGTKGEGELHPAGAFVAVVHTLRKWTAPWLRTLAEEQWDRKALHPERGEQGVRRMVAHISWHLEHHASFLNRKVELLLAKRG